MGEVGQSKVMMRRWWWGKDIKRWKGGSGGALHSRLDCTIPAVVHQVPQSICPENLLRASGEQEEWVSQTCVHVFEGIFLVFHLLSSFQYFLVICFAAIVSFHSSHWLSSAANWELMLNQVQSPNYSLMLASFAILCSVHYFT